MKACSTDFFCIKCTRSLAQLSRNFKAMMEPSKTIKDSKSIGSSLVQFSSSRAHISWPADELALFSDCALWIRSKMENWECNERGSTNRADFKCTETEQASYSNKNITIYSGVQSHFAVHSQKLLMGQRWLRYWDHGIKFVNIHVAITIAVSANKNGFQSIFNIRLFLNKMRSNEIEEICHIWMRCACHVAKAPLFICKV